MDSPRKSRRNLAISLVVGTAIVIVVILAGILIGLAVVGNTIGPTSRSVSQNNNLTKTITTSSPTLLSSSSTTQFTYSRANSTTTLTAFTESATSSSTTTSFAQTFTTSSSSSTTKSSQSTSTTTSSSTTSVVSSSSSTSNQSSLDVQLLGISAYDSLNKVIYFAGVNSMVGINGSTNEIVSNTKIDQNISSMTFDPKNGMLYFAAGNVLYKQNPRSNSYNSIGMNASSILYDPAVDELFAGQQIQFGISAYFLNKIIFVINPQDNVVISNITLPKSGGFGSVNQLALDTANDYIYSSVFGSALGNEPIYLNYVINAATRQVLSELPSEAVSFAYDANSSTMFMASNGYIYLSCVPSCAESAALSPGNNVTVYHGTQAESVLTLNSSPNSTIGSIAYDSGNGKLYLLNSTVNIQRNSQGAVTNITWSNYTLCAISPTTDTVTKILDLNTTYPETTISRNYLLVDPANSNLLYIITPDALYFISIGTST